MTHRPHYSLTIACPRCSEEFDAEFVEVGRYEFSPIVSECPMCGYHDAQEFTRRAWDANDVAAERQGLERVQDV